MEKILTVSVAAYNVEKTIRQTLDSFCQSKYLKKIEVLVVNDGSKDNTANIVKEYEIKYPESIRLISKENGGHGSTINTSIAQGTGKYFKVVDGDDWVDAEALDKLIERLRETNADMVINDYVEVYPNKQIRQFLSDGYEEKKIYHFQEIPLNQKFFMHGVTMLMKLLKQNKYSISEHKFYADNEFVFFVMLLAHTIEFQNNAVYQYRLGTNGQSVSPIGLYNHIEDKLFITERLFDVYSKEQGHLNNQNQQTRLYLFLSLLYQSVFYDFGILKKCDKDYLLKIFDHSMQEKYPMLVSSIPLGKKKIIRWNYIIGLWIFRFWNKIK